MSGLPPRHSFTRSSETDDIAFQEVEHRKASLPISQDFSSAPGTNMEFLGTFRHRLLSSLPVSPCGPFMVELFTPPDLLEYPSLVIGPAPTVTSRRLPTPAHVKRTFLVSPERLPFLPESCWLKRVARPAPIEKGPNPAGGFAANGCSPALSMTASAVAHRATDRSLSASPLLQGHPSRGFHRIEH